MEKRGNPPGSKQGHSLSSSLGVTIQLAILPSYSLPSCPLICTSYSSSPGGRNLSSETLSCLIEVAEGTDSMAIVSEAINQMQGKAPSGWWEVRVAAARRLRGR